MAKMCVVFWKSFNWSARPRERARKRAWIVYRARDEIDASRPFLFEQIKIVQPKVIVALGLPASRCLLRSTESMAKLRAQFHDLELEPGLVIPVMPTYHPAYLLRSYTPENRKKVWEDLQLAMSKLTPA